MNFEQLRVVYKLLAPAHVFTRQQSLQVRFAIIKLEANLRALTDDCAREHAPLLRDILERAFHTIIAHGADIDVAPPQTFQFTYLSVLWWNICALRHAIGAHVDDTAYTQYEPSRVASVRNNLLLLTDAPFARWTADNIRDHLIVLARRIYLVRDNPASRSNPWLTEYVRHLTRRFMHACATDQSLDPAHNFVPLEMHDSVWTCIRLLQLMRTFDTVFNAVHPTNPLECMAGWRNGVANIRTLLKDECGDGSTLLNVHRADIARATRNADLAMGEHAGVRSRYRFTMSEDDAVSVLNRRADVVATFVAYDKYANVSGKTALAQLDALDEVDDRIGWREQVTLIAHMLHYFFVDQLHCPLLDAVLFMHVDDGKHDKRFQTALTRPFPFIYQLCGVFWVIAPSTDAAKQASAVGFTCLLRAIASWALLCLNCNQFYFMSTRSHRLTLTFLAGQTKTLSA